MLIIEVSSIPPEGLDIHEQLQPAELHVEGDESFRLDAGGRLDCHVERGEDETVHVRGRVGASLGLECGRCLEPFHLPVQQELDLFYLPHGLDPEQEQEEEVELTDRDVVVAYYAHNRLDLGEMVREQFFLALPMKRLCQDECRGLCPSCGTNRNLAACECPPPEDARLSPLRTLFDKGSS